MRKTLSLSIVGSLILSSVPADARVLGKTAPVSVAAPAALGLPAGLQTQRTGIGSAMTVPALESGLALVESPVFETAAPAAAAAVPARRTPAVEAAGRSRLATPTAPAPHAPDITAKKARGVPVRASLGRLSESVGRDSKKGSAVSARGISSRFFDASGLNAADKGDGVSSDAVPSSRRMEGLKAPKKGKTLAQKAALPVMTVGAVAAGAAVVADPTLPARVGQWIVQHPVVEFVMPYLAVLPGWAQTGLWVGAGFGAASIAPKIVRPAAKWFFQQVEWNKLREDWLTSVVTYASWFGAVTYAVGMVGGWEALAVNGSVFALTTTFAVKDVAANVADGFFLYQNRTLKIGEPFEALGHKGILDGANPRFVIIDTSVEADAEFDRVLVPNEKLEKEGLGGRVSEGDHDARRFGAAAGVSLASIAAAWAALGPAGQAVVIGAAALWMGRRLNAWHRSQSVKADAAKGVDPLAFRKHRKRATVLWWFRNGVYMAGLSLVLHMFGVPVSGLVGALSVFSAAAGFYMKSVSENLVGGLMIAAYLPFSAGDYIEVGKYKGVVAGMSQSELRLWTGEWNGGNREYVDVPLTLVMKEAIKIRMQDGPVSAARAAAKTE
jgi:small-conductance mechanosensitive channel